MAIKLCPDCFETRCSRGLAFARINDFQNALIDYSEAIALKPNSANAFYNRALAYKNLGHFEEAIGDYSEAIRIDSKHFQALNNRGMALRDMGRFKEAIVDFDRCIAVNPEFAECYWNKALTHLITGDYSVAGASMNTDGKQKILRQKCETLRSLSGLAKNRYLVKQYYCTVSKVSVTQFSSAAISKSLIKKIALFCSRLKNH